MRRVPVAVAAVLAVLLLCLSAGTADRAAAQGGSAGKAVVLRIDGAIGPATADYVERGLEEARSRGARLAIIEMDTPGGLDTSMRRIIRAILASPVPVASYVTPPGARAASAGTYILYASHLAVMAPGTNLGAATPVSLGGSSSPFGIGGGEKEGSGGAGEKGPVGPGDGPAPGALPGTASEAKALNDAVAYIRSLAALRGRNADWAEEAVRGAASLPAGVAETRRVIDFMADDPADLLAKADGRTVRVGKATRQLRTAGITTERLDPDWRNRLLTTITDPNLALILMMIGVYGLLFEFMSPGAVVPGVVGGISLLLGLYALSVLPIDYAGAGLLLLGLALIVAEAFAPSFGILGIGGIAAFAAGAALMFDSDVPGFQVSWTVIGVLAALSAGFLLLLGQIAVRSQRRRVVTGTEQLVGSSARVIDWSTVEGRVFVHGEHWSAVSSGVLRPGQVVEVVAISGLTLYVEPVAQVTATAPPPGTEG